MGAKLIKEYIELDQQIKELEKKKKVLREQIINDTVEYYRQNTHNLETKQVTVPFDFFDKVNLDPKNFIETRFPSWDLNSIKETEDSVIFSLTKMPSYVGREIEEDDYRLGHTVSDGTPQIDWDTLKRDDESLFEAISAVDHVRRLDEDKLEAYINSHPEAFAILERHLCPPRPIIKVIPKGKNE